MKEFLRWLLIGILILFILYSWSVFVYVGFQDEYSDIRVCVVKEISSKKKYQYNYNLKCNDICLPCNLISNKKYEVGDSLVFPSVKENMVR